MLITATKISLITSRIPDQIPYLQDKNHKKGFRAGLNKSQTILEQRKPKGFTGLVNIWAIKYIKRVSHFLQHVHVCLHINVKIIQAHLTYTCEYIIQAHLFNTL